MTKNIEKKYKIAIVSPTPFYYHIPLYKELAVNSEINFVVYYCSDETIKGEDIKKMYKSRRHIANKKELLGGYKYKFFKNYSPNPSFMNWPFGLINFGICKEIFKERPDVVILQSWTNLTWWMAFICCLLTNTKIMFMTDSNILSEPSKSFLKISFKKVFLGNFLFKYSFGFLTSGLANENFYKYYNVPDSKIIRSSFSWGYKNILLKAKNLKSKRDELRKKFNLKKDDFIILYVGRLSEEKNPLIILDAYKNVESINKKLFIIGDGPMRKDFEKKINDLNLKNINIVGFVPHEKIFEFYTMSDLLILPSKHETWGIVVSEAMCFGLPIVASNRIGAAVDLVENGKNGFIFPFNDADILSQSIEKIINLQEKDRISFREESFKKINNWINNLNFISGIINKLKH
jgi:glycosyltransferase involved in cell wall biosynthesis